MISPIGTVDSVNSYYENPFRSFWMAGFECTDKLNAFGHRVDFLNLTGHLQLINEDYQKLEQFNIQSVREGIRWSHVEKRPYEYDWSTVAMMIRQGKICGIQQIWDLCHFGFPDDLTPLHPMFSRRFTSLCRAFVQFYSSQDAMRPLIVIPINEVSFLSWLGGDVRGTSPYCVGQGWEVKYRLMRAYIEGVAAMREVDPSVRILTSEPLVQMVPPLNANEQQIRDAELSHEYQFQSVDILCGRICPELGGSPDYLDILGYNFYYDNQWINGTREFLPWLNLDPDERWRPFRSLIKEAYNRYQRPVAITETGHSGEDRPLWIKYIAKECASLIEENIPFWGICLYPIIDRPDWDHMAPWHGSGLWDVELQLSGPPARVLYDPMAESLKEAQLMISSLMNEIELPGKNRQIVSLPSPELPSIREQL
jgi:hypothetical protein